MILGIDREDLDESLLHMFTKMMATHIDVLGPRVKLRKPCQIKGIWVVFKEVIKSTVVLRKYTPSHQIEYQVNIPCMVRTGS
jgi:hypothetical protein